jgi:hypothetical protein
MQDRVKGRGNKASREGMNVKQSVPGLCALGGPCMLENENAPMFPLLSSCSNCIPPTTIGLGFSRA